jgi:hypothetical protein
VVSAKGYAPPIPRRARAARLRAALKTYRKFSKTYRKFSPGPARARFYDWAWLDINTPGQTGHSLLIRRHPGSGELAYYRCWTPHPVPLAALVRVAGTR